MPRITYIEHDGTRHLVDVPEGWSVMEGAVKNSVPGIEADCGGACACATCHVKVAPEWADRLPPKEEGEESMLEFVQEPGPDSRLSCQIKVTPDLEGLVVTLPSSQY